MKVERADGSRNVAMNECLSRFFGDDLPLPHVLGPYAVPDRARQYFLLSFYIPSIRRSELES